MSNASVFFIKPTFSKSASSPTKMGELLSMGVPIITNTGIGDVDAIVKETKCGVTISNFDEKSYEIAIADLLQNTDLYKKNTVTTALTYFSLQDGVEKYAAVYKHLNKI
jgi:glycosyltransferase involved in cell wall biosynthesis